MPWQQAGGLYDRPNDAAVVPPGVWSLDRITQPMETTNDDNDGDNRRK